MSRVFIPAGYQSVLSLYETQEAIGLIKKIFQGNLSHALHLKRVSAPLFVDGASGLNDDLNGVERPVSFDMLETGKEAQVVHSLAKWKRYALQRYHFPVGEGLYTDMNAIRRDEALDNLHSVYVDQWDWEKVIQEEERNLDTLKDAMQRIVDRHLRHAGSAEVAVSPDQNHPVPGCDLRHHPGAGGHVSRQNAQGAGKPFPAGAPHRGPAANRGQAALGQAA